MVLLIFNSLELNRMMLFYRKCLIMPLKVRAAASKLLFYSVAAYGNILL